MAGRFANMIRNGLFGGPARVQFAPPQGAAADVPAMSVTVDSRNLSLSEVVSLATPVTVGQMASGHSALGLTKVAIAPQSRFSSAFLTNDRNPSNGQH
jgi:hypothetical protein